MLKLNSYSSIRKEPLHKPADGYNLTSFYEGVLKPPVVLAIITGYLAIFQKDNVLTKLDSALKGDEGSVLHLSLVLFSVITGIRIIQSAFLAKRDYQHLKNSLFDIFVFMVVIIFTSGAAVVYSQKNYLFVIILYLVGAIIGAINFYHLYRYRIPKSSELYDYPIEKKIQVVNMLVFLAVAALLGYAAFSMTLAGHPISKVCVAIFLTYIPLMLNMIHSQQLTLMPKFLIHNDPDKPERQVSLFRSVFWRTSYSLQDSEIMERIKADVPERFRNVRLVRAQPSDIDKVAEELVNEFSLIYEYILNTKSKQAIHRVLKICMQVAGGLGSFGYMSFYMIRSEDHSIGFVMLQSSKKCVFYIIYEIIVLPLRLYIAGCRNLFKIHTRLRQTLRDQIEPDEGDIFVNYLVIFPVFRNHGYGHAVINLLISALARNITNDIECNKITLFVRENNRLAKALFLKSGFKVVRLINPPPQTPLSALSQMEFIDQLRS